MQSAGAAACVIINPVAGAGSSMRVWPVLAARLRELGVPHVHEMTYGPGSATAITRQALQRDIERIVVVGGDGTVNEVVNGFFIDSAPVHANASLAIVPAGSSCDIARNLGLPARYAALDALIDDRTVTVDVGRADFAGSGIDEWYFLNNADVGFGAAIARGARRFKRLGGRFAFFAATAGVLIRPSPWDGQVMLDNVRRSVRALTVVVALGAHTAGGMQLAPGARMDDGLFDVVTIDAMSAPRLFFNLCRTYSGAHVRDPRIHMERTRTVHVEPRGLQTIQLDGEERGHAPARFTVLPRSLRVHAPSQ